MKKDNDTETRLVIETAKREIEMKLIQQNMEQIKTISGASKDTT